jgi:hypothetical protein
VIEGLLLDTVATTGEGVVGQARDVGSTTMATAARALARPVVGSALSTGPIGLMGPTDTTWTIDSHAEGISAIHFAQVVGVSALEHAEQPGPSLRRPRPSRTGGGGRRATSPSRRSRPSSPGPILHDEESSRPLLDLLPSREHLPLEDWIDTDDPELVALMGAVYNRIEDQLADKEIPHPPTASV